MTLIRSVFYFLCSLKLAVVLVLTLAATLCGATFLESYYDTATAQYWVYQSQWFFALLFLLGLQIFCVAMRRYPWKLKHIPFLMAHLGILILLYGAWLTQRKGLDGSMRIQEGHQTSFVEINSANLILTDHPTVKLIPVKWVPPHVNFKPMTIPGFDLKIDRFLSHAEPQVSFVPTQEIPSFPAIHFRITGGPMQISQDFWLWAGDPSWSSVDAGPARFSLGNSPAPPQGQPWLSFSAKKDGRLEYRAISSTGLERKGSFGAGHIQGQTIDPGWRGNILIHIEHWIARAQAHTEYHTAEVQYGAQAPPPAMHLITTRNEGLWLGLGDHAELQYGDRQIGVEYTFKRVMLPFQLRLERFIVDHYPGTQDPSSFRSKVTVLDDREGHQQSEISMNEPLVHQGITFYQASYENAEPRPMVSIFSVNQDPGRFLKYLGSLLLVLGVILLFIRKYLKNKNSHPLKAAKTIVLFLLVLAGAVTECSAASVQPRSGWSFQRAALLPIQSGGRVKPLDSFARESILFLTGSRSFERWNPVELLFSWVSFPYDWQEKNFIQVSREDVKKQLGLNIHQKLFNIKQLIHSPFLAQYAQKISSDLVTAKATKQDPSDQELRRVLDRIGLFRHLVSGEALSFLQIPSAREGFAELIRGYHSGDQEKFYEGMNLVQQNLEQNMPEWNPGLKNKLQAEVWNHHWRPFLLAWIFYLLGTLAWLVGGRTYLAWIFTGLGFCSHVFGFGLRCYVAGRPPVTNMYESIVWVSLGVVLFAMILYRVHRQRILMTVATSLAVLGLIVADAAPAVMDSGIHPLVPVLRSNLWLTIHVLTITLGYAAFALTLGLGNVSLYQFLLPQNSQQLSRVTTLNQLTYRSMQFGVVLLAAGTILGGVWADYSWGRFWGWDPKEVWALIALLGYLAILHARYTGWMGQFGFAAWSVLSFLLVLMAWYGVNFVLGVGLHSYGFSTGGRIWMLAFLVIQLGYVGGVALKKTLQKQGVPSTSS